MLNEKARLKQEDINWLNDKVNWKSRGSNPDHYKILKFLIAEQKNIFPQNNLIYQNIESRKKITELFIKFLNNGDWMCSNLILNSFFNKFIDFSNQDLKKFAFIHLKTILKPKKKLNKLDQLTNRNIGKFVKHLLLILEKFNFSSKEISNLSGPILQRILFEQENIKSNSSYVSINLQKLFKEYIK